ncbi:MAG: hypothetical protein NC489_08810 [Ruminococcus flavefaciens]|nr:hypothetical protein [Ruminococcus flavefaciens]
MHTEGLQYVLQRAITATAMIETMKLTGRDRMEFTQRHYSATYHGLAAMGISGDDQKNLLKRAEQQWIQKGGLGEWPYPILAS